jgi:cysteine synthase B
MQKIMTEILDDIETAVMARLGLIANEVGNTPLHLFTSLSNNPNVKILGKKEWEQLGGSVKIRAAYRIIRQAILNGELRNDKILLDATSGNTGIAYASIAAKIGIRVTLCLPENASQERKDILESLGVEIIPTSRFEGTDGAQEVAKALFRENPGTYFYADQYRNDNNWQAHHKNGTADEIYNSLPEITHFVSALGSTGTLVGTGRRLKEIDRNIQIIGLQPDSPMHGLEGWKHLETALVPTIYDPNVADEIVEISAEESYETIKKIYKDEGLLLSPSSAGNIVGALKISERLEYGTIVTMLPDNADKYSEIIKKIL